MKNDIIINASAKHKLGNVISGFCQIIDGVVLILSLGNINIRCSLRWTMRRYTTKILSDNN